MANGNRSSRRRSSRIEREYVRSVDGDEGSARSGSASSQTGRKPSSGRSTEHHRRERQQRRMWRVEEGSGASRSEGYSTLDNRDDRVETVNASTSSGRRSGGSRRHRRRGNRHYDDGYVYVSGNDSNHHRGHRDRYYYYGRRDPESGRFVEASDRGSCKDGGSGNDNSNAPGFVDYLKSVFGGYGPDNVPPGNQRRGDYRYPAERRVVGAETSARRGYDYDDAEERRAYREGFRDGYDDRGSHVNASVGGDGGEDEDDDDDDDGGDGNYDDEGDDDRAGDDDNDYDDVDEGPSSRRRTRWDYDGGRTPARKNGRNSKSNNGGPSAMSSSSSSTTAGPSTSSAAYSDKNGRGRSNGNGKGNGGRRVTAGGGYGDNAGYSYPMWGGDGYYTAGCCSSRRTRCCSEKPTCPSSSVWPNQPAGSDMRRDCCYSAPRGRSCSLKAGGNGGRSGSDGRRNDNNDDDDDYSYGDGGGGRMGSRRGRSGRGRPRSASAAQPSSSSSAAFGTSFTRGGNGRRRRGGGDDDDDDDESGRRNGRNRSFRDRSNVRGSSGRDGYNDGGDGSSSDSPERRYGRTRRLGMQPPGRHNYVPPEAMMNGPHMPMSPIMSDDDSRDPDYRRYDSDSSDVEIKLPPFLDGLMSVDEFDSLMPTSRIISQLLGHESKEKEVVLYSRMQEFGPAVFWSDRDRRPQYERGNMYCSNPGGDATAWTRSAKQSNAMITRMCRDSLREAVDAMGMTQGTAVLFLLDAAMRIAANRQSGSSGSLPGKNPIPHVFRRLPQDAAPLLLKGPTHHARGATAATLRSSYGSMIYWPHIRGALTGPTSGEYVCYLAAYVHKCQTYLGARSCRDGTSLTEFDLDALGECFSVGLVSACVATQYLYMIVGRGLHQSVENMEYEALADVEPYVRFPMGSKLLMQAETVCLGSLDERGDVGVGIAGSLVSTHVAIRSALTEIMSEYAECEDCTSFEPSSEATATVALMAMVLQRLLGYLNILACYIIIASLYHGRNVKVREKAFAIYDYLFRTCMPLYRAVTVGEFNDDREKALQEIGCVLTSGDPPSRQGGTITPLNVSEISALRMTSVEGYGVLGKRVSVPQVFGDAKELLLGSDAMAAIKSEITGERKLGLGPRGSRYNR